MNTAMNISDSGSSMLLLGVGKVGGRAAYYAYQRGSLPGLRIAAMDSDEASLQELSGLNTILLPPISEVAQFIPVEDEEAEAAEAFHAEGAASSGEESDQSAAKENTASGAVAEEILLATKISSGLSARGREQLYGVLDAHFSTLKMMVVIMGLGGNCGGFYGLEALRYARQRGICVCAVCIMPHPFESRERHQLAVKRLHELHELTQAHIVLPCTQFVPLFQEDTSDEAFSQGVRWLTECALGFLRPFAIRPKKAKVKELKSSLEGGSNQMLFVFEDQSLGIFNGVHPTNVNGQNLDIPTFQRLHLEFDTVAEINQ